MATLKRTKRILLVEDDRTIAEVMRKLLLDAGYHHLKVIQTSKFMQRVLFEFKPDLVLLDIMLPKDDGREIGLGLKEDPATASLPIIVFTALPDAAQIALDIKADGYIKKPFKKADLLRKIDALLTKKKKAAKPKKKIFPQAE